MVTGTKRLTVVPSDEAGGDFVQKEMHRRRHRSRGPWWSFREGLLQVLFSPRQHRRLNLWAALAILAIVALLAVLAALSDLFSRPLDL